MRQWIGYHWNELIFRVKITDWSSNIGSIDLVLEKFSSTDSMMNLSNDWTTENARRLMTLGTLRPSKTFYRHLPAADVNHLMNYFRRMKTTNQRVTSEEFNQELADKHVEYKPKICEFLCLLLEHRSSPLLWFSFDSACVTKTRVAHVGKNEENSPIDQRILSIEFIPLSCILDSMDIPNQFIIDCDSIETKQLLMEKPLKITVHKHSTLLELQSHDEGKKRASSTKK